MAESPGRPDGEIAGSEAKASKDGESLSRLATLIRAEMGLAAVGLRVRQGNGMRLRLAHGLSEADLDHQGGSLATPATTESCLLSNRREIDDHPSFRQLPDEFETFSVIAVRSGGEPVGILYLADPRPQAVSSDDVAYLEVLLSHFARSRLGAEHDSSSSSAPHPLGADRKQAEEALAASEARLQEAAEAAGVVTYTWDFTTGSAGASPPLLALYGLGPDEPLAVDDDSVPLAIHPADRATFLKARLAATDPLGSGIFEVEFRIRHKDGGLRWLRIRGRTTFVAGRPHVAHGIVHDITGHRLAAEQLELFKFSIDHAPNSAYWMDPEGRFVYANDAGCRTLGYTQEEILRMHVSDVNTRVTPERWQEVWQTLRQKGEFTTESEHRRKDGTLFPVEIVSAYFTYDGREYCNGFARDITSRRQVDRERETLQAQLLQAQKMESVGRLAGGVAHDFNNMLGVILGNTELVLTQLGPSSPVHADLLEIQAAAKRSAELTRQLLAFARRQPAAPRPLDLNETVRGMLPMLRRLVGEEIELTWEPASNLWQVNMDPSQVGQVLASLTVNARDAIHDVGKVRLWTLNTTLDPAPRATHPSREPGDYVVLGISDSGCGMTSETVDRLFEPFFTTKEDGTGAGLGLAMVYGIVTQNGGFIEVDSKPGAGSVFKIYLGRHHSTSVANPETRPREVAPDMRKTILVVEDEPAILRLGRRILERQNYQVLTAATPSEALAILENHSGRIDLLLVDVVMPEMNGRELARVLAERRPGLRALFMSGYPAEHIAHRGIVEEGLHFLQKPFTGQELVAKVREALDN